MATKAQKYGILASFHKFVLDMDFLSQIISILFALLSSTKTELMSLKIGSIHLVHMDIKKNVGICQMANLSLINGIFSKKVITMKESLESEFGIISTKTLQV